MLFRSLFLLPFLFFTNSCSTISKPFSKPSSPTTAAKDCLVIRGVFDIGSGSTRLKVAKVDQCQNRVSAILLEREEKVDYKGDLLQNHEAFSVSIQNQGEEVLKKLKAEGDTLKVQEYVAVATAAFRSAKNAKPFIEKLNLDLQINAQIITQEEEAVIGFYAASQSLSLNPENTLIWDIGGGSQQMIHYAGKNKIYTYKGKLASAYFKDYVLKYILKKHAKSPNPMNSYQIKLAVQHARDVATKTVKGEIRNFLLTQPNIIGIGGVHYYSVIKQIDPSGRSSSYTIDELEKTLQKSIGLRDEEILDQKYADTEITNLALVLGYMQALKIKQVNVLNVNLTDGLLLDYKYWTP